MHLHQGSSHPKFVFAYWLVDPNPATAAWNLTRPDPLTSFVISRTGAPFPIFRKGELRRQGTFLLPAASVVLLFQIQSTRRDSRSISVVGCQRKAKEPTVVPFQMLRQECSKLFTRVFFSRVRGSLAGTFSPCTLSGRIRCRCFAPIPATSRRRLIGLKIISLSMLIGG